MKIIFNYSSLGNGGAERCMTALANYCVEKGDEAFIIVNDSSDNKHILDPKVKVISFNNIRFSENAINGIIENIKEIKLLKQQIKRIDPDVVFCFSAKNALMCKLASPKTVVIGSERANPVVCRTSKKDKLFVRLSDILNGFVFQTNGAKEFYPKKIKAKSTVIPNGIAGDIENAAITPYEKRPEYSICATGRLIKVKRYDLLIKAMKDVVKKYPSAYLDIYGDGVLSEKIKEDIIKNGLQENIFLKGHSADIYSELIAHRYFVLCSDNEGMPNGLIDAMASGCVSISTNCDFGPTDLIKDNENGFLIPCNDSNALAEKIISAIESADQGSISQKALLLREELSKDKIFDKFYNYFLSCIVKK